LRVDGLDARTEIKSALRVVRPEGGEHLADAEGAFDHRVGRFGAVGKGSDLAGLQGGDRHAVAEQDAVRGDRGDAQAGREDAGEGSRDLRR